MRPYFATKFQTPHRRQFSSNFVRPHRPGTPSPSPYLTSADLPCLSPALLRMPSRLHLFPSVRVRPRLDQLDIRLASIIPVHFSTPTSHIASRLLHCMLHHVSGSTHAFSAYAMYVVSALERPTCQLASGGLHLITWVTGHILLSPHWTGGESANYFQCSARLRRKQEDTCIGTSNMGGQGGGPTMGVRIFRCMKSRRHGEVRWR